MLAELDAPGDNPDLTELGRRVYITRVRRAGNILDHDQRGWSSGGSAASTRRTGTSRRAPVPYAVGNVLLTIWGAVIVLLHH